MSRLGPRPPVAEHDQHDALLVAQLAAGDALEASQQREAGLLVSSCTSCASLAADLRAVSSAVAWEPVPPRRRDFRIDPEQAEHLQGNAVSRFLHRLSLPSARALQPAAAGVMSIGLVFVVAGYVWPDDGTASMAEEANVAPAAVEERATSSSAPVDLLLPAEAPEVGAVMAEEAELFEVEPMAPGAPADEQAAARPKAGGAAKAAARDERQAPELESAAGATEELRAMDAAPVEALGAEPVDAVKVDALEPDAFEPDSAVAEAGLDVLTNDGDFEDTVSPSSGAEVVVAAPLDENPSLESLLVVVGFALALAGGLVLLLIWLARRHADPLLR